MSDHAKLILKKAGGKSSVEILTLWEGDNLEIIIKAGIDFLEQTK